MNAVVDLPAPAALQRGDEGGDGVGRGDQRIEFAKLVWAVEVAAGDTQRVDVGQSKRSQFASVTRSTGVFPGDFSASDFASRFD